MRLEELRKLKEGDRVRFNGEQPHFGNGEEYIVEDTSVGRMIMGDNGIGYYLYDGAGMRLYEGFSVVGPTVEPIAWACRTCNKIDWVDSEEQLARPEHISHRGVDIGECEGEFIPLYMEQKHLL